MPSFVALYRGQSIREAQMVGVSVDPELVAHVAGRMLQSQGPPSADPAIAALQNGRRQALRHCTDSPEVE